MMKIRKLQKLFAYFPAFLFSVCFVLLITFSACHINTDGKAIYADSIAPNSDQMSDINSYEFSKELGRGWNLGNTLEAIGGETAWGNPKTSKQLIDSVKAAGFNLIRIPVAWSVFSDSTTYTIDKAWITRVEEVVNYALTNDMYVLLNEHWDGGWLQPTYTNKEEGNMRLAIIWKQLAIHFRDYNDHLIFAGTNEVMVEGDYGMPTKEYYSVQNSFNQTFINTIRATGGRNYYRFLTVQGFNTNINHTLSFFTMPNDVVDKKLLVEVHYYDPYEFTLNENSKQYAWGKADKQSLEYGNEDFVDKQFKRMKIAFVDKGYGVIIGEYGSMAKLNLGDELNTVHADNRLYWIKYVTHSAVKHGLIPVYWDNGYTSDHAFGLFNRTTGQVAFPELISAIMDTSLLQHTANK